MALCATGDTSILCSPPCSPSTCVYVPYPCMAPPRMPPWNLSPDPNTTTPSSSVTWPRKFRLPDMDVDLERLLLLLLRLPLLLLLPRRERDRDPGMCFCRWEQRRRSRGLSEGLHTSPRRGCSWRKREFCRGGRHCGGSCTSCCSCWEEEKEEEGGPKRKCGRRWAFTALPVMTVTVCVEYRHVVC